MKELIDAIEKIGQVVEAVQEGFSKFEASLPLLTKQQLNVIAKKKLGGSLQNFMDATKVEYRENLLIVEIDPENWLANAVEEGADPFDMRKTLLMSPKAKMSKAGYKYMSVPIAQMKGKQPTEGSDKSAMWQSKINEVLTKPKFGLSQLKAKLDGSVTNVQPVTSGSPSIPGLYRVQSFDSMDSLVGKKKPSRSQYVLFRTISNNPAKLQGWQHPGIAPSHILRELELWLGSTVESLLDRMIEEELNKVL